MGYFLVRIFSMEIKGYYGYLRLVNNLWCCGGEKFVRADSRRDVQDFKSVRLKRNMRKLEFGNAHYFKGLVYAWYENFEC